MKYIFFLASALLIQSAAAKTFINCSEASPASFNPQVVTDAPSYNASAITLYSKLLRFELGTTKMIPALAESYTISKDEKKAIKNTNGKRGLLSPL